MSMNYKKTPEGTPVLFFFCFFSEWDYLKTAVNFASVLIHPINGPSMLNNVLLVPVLTAQLLPAAVVTGDSDQAKP